MHLYSLGILGGSFLILSFSGFGNARQCWPHKMSLGVFPPFNILEEYAKDGIYSSVNSSVKQSGPRLFFVGRFMIPDSISLLIIGLFRFSVSS